MSYITVAAEREMTVQDLLRHTAGLAYGEITGSCSTASQRNPSLDAST
jgi:CubicO group peptidase (beta-lactamase class C family)